MVVIETVVVKVQASKLVVEVDWIGVVVANVAVVH